MSITKYITYLVAVGATLMASSMAARAVSESDAQNNTSGSAFDGDILSTDLLNGITPNAVFTVTTANYTAGDTLTTGDSGNGILGANDGTATVAYFGDGQTGTELAAQPQLTYTFDTSANTLGYSLSLITIINGYTKNYSAELADQDYTISYSTVADPNVFLTLDSVNFSPYTSSTDAAGSTNASTEVQLTDLTGALGVKSLRFTFMDPPDETEATNGEMIREIDVTGIATVPEPASYLLFALSAGAAFLFLRRRSGTVSV